MAGARRTRHCITIDEMPNELPEAGPILGRTPSMHSYDPDRCGASQILVNLRPHLQAIPYRFFGKAEARCILMGSLISR